MLGSLNNAVENWPEDAMIVRYLLNDLPEADSEQFEESYCSNQNLFQLMQATEEELIEDYLCGRLARRERVQFERHYLTTPERRERVEFARDLLDAVDLEAIAEEEETPANPAPTSTPVVVAPKKVSLWDSVAAYLRLPAMAIGSATAALLFLALGLWMLVRNERLNQQVASLTAVAKQRQDKQEELEGQIARERVENAQLKTERTTLKQQHNYLEDENKRLRARAAEQTSPQPQLAFVTYDLPSTVQSGGGRQGRLVIPSGTQQVQLRFILDREVPALKTYRAELKTQAGENLIPEQGTLKSIRKRVTVKVPADKFASGLNKYVLQLWGVTADGRPADIGRRYFEAEKK